MNKVFIPLSLSALLIACSGENKHGTAGTSDSIGSLDSVGLSSQQVDTSIYDESSDIMYTTYEGNLVEQLPTSSLIANLANSNETVKLFGNKYNGQFLFEGDILIDYPDTINYPKASGITTLSKKWRKTGNKLIIPFAIASTITNRQKINTAMKMWTDNVGIRSVQRTGQLDYIHFVPTAEGCFVEKVGRSGGEQPVRISSECKAGNIAHEIGHILGLFHEQSRNDRDSFVTIDFGAAGGKAFQYRFSSQLDPSGKPMDIGDYDFNSIMHYPERSYLQVKPSFRDKLPIGIPGQRDSLSRGDIAAVKNMYGLP